MSGPCELLLSSDDQRFIDDFMGLTRSQQCLIVRFINRKSKFINPNGYVYDEIENIQDNLYLLYSRGWFRSIETEAAAEFIQHLTKEEIIQLIDQLNDAGFSGDSNITYKKSQTKIKLLENLSDTSSSKSIPKTAIGQNNWQSNLQKNIS